MKRFLIGLIFLLPFQIFADIYMSLGVERSIIIQSMKKNSNISYDSVYTENGLTSSVKFFSPSSNIGFFASTSFIPVSDCKIGYYDFTKAAEYSAQNKTYNKENFTGYFSDNSYFFNNTIGASCRFFPDERLICFVDFGFNALYSDLTFKEYDINTKDLILGLGSDFSLNFKILKLLFLDFGIRVNIDFLKVTNDFFYFNNIGIEKSWSATISPHCSVCIRL